LAPPPGGGPDNGSEDSDGVDESLVNALAPVRPPELRALLFRADTVEVTVENPGVNDRVQSLWHQTYTHDWLAKWGGLVRLHATSYCKHAAPGGSELPPKKDTTILSTMEGLSLPPPCTAGRPCEERKRRGTHRTQVSGRHSLPEAQRNALPPTLVHRVLAAWTERKWRDGYRAFLVVDAFAGWGSMHAALRTFPHP